MTQEQLIAKLKAGPDFMGYDEGYLVLMYHKDTYQGQHDTGPRSQWFNYERIGDYECFYLDID